MLTYVVRRLLYGVLTFFGITIAIFVLVHSVPGDPITFYAGSHGPSSLSHAVLAEIRHAHHLDEPVLQQYGWWLRGILTFDFGTSFIDHQPVTKRIAARLPNTIILNVIAFLVAALIGVPIGLWSAARSGRPIERASAVTFFLLYSLPSFWVALLLMQFFAVRLNVLPLFGMTSDEYLDLNGMMKIADRAKHLVLPVITLAYAELALFARFSKSALTEVIRQDYITTARAKGATNGAVLWRHGFRNALIPLITLLGITLPYLISGSV
ncbi:MAG: peptide/nickel transport system permease protein, partial [Thermoanaerobaculia bacterium]|nr:peptide/nickel transport system permease protein [Thermoanaerobaculia bacterium]